MLEFFSNSVIIQYIINNAADIILLLSAALVFIGFCSVQVRKGNWDLVRQILLGLVIEAEKYLGSKTGELKKQQVIDWMYQRHPLINMCVSRDTLNYLVEQVLLQMKEQLAKTGGDLDTLENNLLMEAKANASG